MNQLLTSTSSSRCIQALQPHAGPGPCSTSMPFIVENLRRSPRRLIAARAGPEDAEQPDSISATARRLYDRLQAPPRPGSEYGEGFVQFRIGGGPVLLDVDTLNYQLRHTGLKHSQRPDEAFGMVFCFDGVVADTRRALYQAWCRLAESKSLPFAHSPAQVLLHNTCPERIIIDVLGWTRSMNAARQLSHSLAELYHEELMQLTEPAPGLRGWLEALTNFNVPCALVSTLDKATTRRVIERMHLHDHFNTMVTADDDMETISQNYLSAALSLARPPNCCVVFAAMPEGITAAHNASMKAVAVCNAFPAYKLKQADVTCSSLSELTVYNIRRLFAQRGDEFMDLRKQRVGDEAPNSKRRIANAML